MKRRLRLGLAVSFVAFFGGELCFAQGSQSREKLLEQAHQIYCGEVRRCGACFRKLVETSAPAYL